VRDAVTTPSPYAAVILPFDARDQIERALLGRTTLGGAAAVMSLLIQWPCIAPQSSTEDTPPAPEAPVQQWAVRHPDVSLSVHGSPHSVLYTASKLPGGVIVTRMSDQAEWRVETDCLCGSTKPADRHYQACPADLSEVPARGDR
jgi:hypothetical protein